MLLIVFMASVAATSLMTLQGFTLHRSALLLNQQQARLYTLGAEQWSIALLKRDLRSDLENNERVDTLEEDWATIPPSLPVEGGFVSGRIEDLQGRFNLNNLLKVNKRPGEDSKAQTKPDLPRAKRKEGESSLNEDNPLEEKQQAEEEPKAAGEEKNGNEEEDKDDEDKERWQNRQRIQNH